MAQLIVRNLEEDLVVRLRQRAAQNHRSAEEEHRQMLRGALLPERALPPLKAHLASIPNAGRDEDFARHPDRTRRPVKL